MLSKQLNIVDGHSPNRKAHVGTPLHPPRLLLLLCLFVSAALSMGGAWATPSKVGQLPTEVGQLPTEERDDADLTKHLTAILMQQAAQWNEGNLDRFMDAYWNNEKLTFSSGGKTNRGWKATLDHYRATYPDRKTMGKLTFSDIEVERLNDGAALVLGRWHLEREKPASGNYSLVWKQIEGKWLIIHDHSSSDAK